MVTMRQGKLDSKGLKIGIVLSRYNEFMSGKLLEGALDALQRTGASDADITVVKVPGAFELPQAAAKLAASGRYDGVICLGVLIRGATPHFDFLAAEAAKGIAVTALKSGVPITFGVLTTETIEQAIERSGSKSGNKGFDSAMALIEMVNLFRTLGE
jgi:6,7-dimethyl-8-ribityllumazine synthase